jgi:rod shape determining protein RodA
LVIARGLYKKVAVLFVIIGLISVPFLGNIFWEGLKDYQKSRLVAFIEPEIDPAGIGYHLNQSKITVGSGKFFGKGFMQGTQGPFRFYRKTHGLHIRGLCRRVGFLKPACSFFISF